LIVILEFKGIVYRLTNTPIDIILQEAFTSTGRILDDHSEDDIAGYLVNTWSEQQDIHT